MSKEALQCRFTCNQIYFTCMHLSQRAVKIPKLRTLYIGYDNIVTNVIAKILKHNNINTREFEGNQCKQTDKLVINSHILVTLSI